LEGTNLQTFRAAKIKGFTVPIYHTSDWRNTSEPLSPQGLFMNSLDKIQLLRIMPSFFSQLEFPVVSGQHTLSKYRSLVHTCMSSYSGTFFMWNLTSRVRSTLRWSAELKHRNILANAVHVCGDWQHLKRHWVKGKCHDREVDSLWQCRFPLGLRFPPTHYKSPNIEHWAYNSIFFRQIIWRLHCMSRGSLSMTLCRVFSRTFLFQKTPPAELNLSQSPAPFVGMISSSSPIAAYF
jgi:hypothetical protein